MLYAAQDEYNRWYTDNYYGIPLIVLYPFSFFLCSVCSYLCLTNKLSIKQDKIFLPPPRYGSYPVQSLFKVSLEHSSDGNKIKSLLLFFNITNDKGETEQLFERIATSRIGKKKGKKLLQILERSCPKCTIDNDAKNFLLGQHLQQLKSAVQNNDSTELEYHSHERVRKFLELIKSYESYFWKVYLTVCLFPIMLLAPQLLCVLLPTLINKMGGQPPPAYPPWLADWNTAVGQVINFIIRSIEPVGTSYFKFMVQPETVFVLLILCAIVAVRFIQFLLQPNKLLLSETGLTLSHKMKGLTLSNTKKSWSDFNRITLLKPKGTTAPEQWQIAFHGRRGKPFTLNLSALKGEADREIFLNSVEQHAPQLTRDAELIETLRPAQKQSYTELWLQSLTTPPKRERLAPLSAGQVLRNGKYVIVDQLGTGGQGIAYLGQENATEQSIVVKEFVLPVFVDRGARRQALEKFENEAVLLHGLSHQRIVKLLDYFVEDHRGYLVLEHINGLSLRRMVEDNGPFAQEQVMALAEQMCDILKYLHSLEPPLVHRDFTPDNLILNSNGILKLIDFNVAHQKDSRTTATVVGKHAYLPPEQFRGKPIPQSDIYAMGASLHYLLTGKDPEPVNVAHPILLNQSINHKLDALIAKATELDTKQRYQSAEQLLTDLTEIIESQREMAGAEPTRVETHADKKSAEIDEENRTVSVKLPRRDVVMAEESIDG